MNRISFLLGLLALTILPPVPLHAVDLPTELPLWENDPPVPTAGHDAEEQVRSAEVDPNSLSGSNRAFSQVLKATYSLHRPEQPNGVGLVICPGGGFAIAGGRRSRC